MSLNRNSFLSYKDLPRKEVAIPELGGAVYVRTLTARERDAFEIANTKAHARDFRARLVVATACDEAGVDLFRVDDVAAVSNLSCSVLDPIVDAALAINRFTKGDVEAVEKNSEASPSTGSPSASPPTSE